MAGLNRRSRARLQAPGLTSPKARCRRQKGQERNYADVEERILGGTTARRGDVVITRGEGCWVYRRRRQEVSRPRLRPGRGDARALPSGRDRRDPGAGRDADALPQLSLQRQARRVCPGARRRAAETPAARVSRQQRRRSRGRRAEVRAAGDQAARVRRHHEGFSRPHDGRAVGDVGAEISRRLYAAAGNHARAIQRCGGAGQGDHGSDRRGDPRSGAGRERRQRRDAGFSEDRTAAVPRSRRPPDRRRNPDRLRPHRKVVRHRTFGHRARHHLPGQGPRRRFPDGRVCLHQGGARRAHTRRARQHLRRFAAGVCGGSCGDRGLSR